ncbi:MAG: sigma-70 family RNA polymerase sigma factor [Firmicutes bacterium]|nr:sigma-70 family RNA polymerase sigma factor [Bacillota bacterium]
MEEQERRYVLIIKKQRIEVTKEVYKTYYKLTERERYLNKLAGKKHISLETYHQNGLQVDYLLLHPGESIEDNIIKKETLEKLALCLETLSEQERLLIYALFFQGKSERQLSAETEMPQRTINDRKRKILLKLKKLMEK